MNLKNLLIVFVLISATLIAFFLGGYHTLVPFLFLGGLAFASAVCIWAALRMKTRDLLVLTLVTIAMATIDEYAHTSAKTFTYFDYGVPSPLTVFGWGLFIIVILMVAKSLNKMIELKTGESGALRVLPALVSITLLIVSVVIQGYLTVISWLLSLIYIIMGITSLYYSYNHSLGWNVSTMISSLVVGALMEFVGALEGLWFFHFMEPLSLFMAFTWTLRTWTILAICSLLDVDFVK